MEELQRAYRDGLLAAEVIAQVPEMLEILKKLSRLCPSAEGLGGHAPLSAFYQVAWEARRLITQQQEIR